LARFSLEGLSVKARILSDDSIIASFLLLNCLLDDMRRGREEKLNRLIERSQDSTLPRSVSLISASTESLATKSMIDVVVQIKDKNIFTDVRVYSFTIILSVEYLLKIADFLTIPQEDLNQPVLPPKPLATGGGISAKTSVTTNTDFITDKQDSQITLNLKIEKPDIILVEHMDSPETQALVLNSEILVKLRISGSHQVINGSVKDLQLYTCNYNQFKRTDAKSNVLYPVTISLAGSTPEGKGLHVEVCSPGRHFFSTERSLVLASRYRYTFGRISCYHRIIEQSRSYRDRKWGQYRSRRR
jgi:vacuolar protein sorting-associated protein 13A/C